MAMPQFITSNGVGRFGFTSYEGNAFRVVAENTMDFTGMAFCINAGLTILSSSRGRDALRRVGDTVVHEWRATDSFDFAGDRRQMAAYVDRFLLEVRNDFPSVVQTDQGPDVIAETRRIGGQFWNGSFQRVDPKRLGGFYYNRRKVAEMSRAGREAGSRNSHERKMAKRWRSYLFMFSLATAHELSHLFIAFLAQGSRADGSFTPPEVSYLNYARERNRLGQAIEGESGRWLESQLLGGSLEFYRDTNDDSGQTGIPYILRSDAKAIRVSAECIDNLVRNVQNARFPLATAGKALTTQERRARGLLSMGTTHANTSQRTAMRARSEGPLYNISANELSRVPLEPRYRLRSQRVA